MKKQSLTTKGLILGLVLLAMTVLSTVLVFSLREKAGAEAEARTEKTLP
jgi:hypothetical protein